HVESTYARTMTSPDLRNVQEATEFRCAFGLTDNSLPGLRFKVLMIIILNILENDDHTL
ncbi:hypothetical protein K435DRAFT_676041, partial [Dendrothele bispora CBS 962.96]